MTGPRPLPPTPHRRQFGPVPDDGTPRPLWSVMIPVFNAAHDLRRSLTSVLAQAPDPSVMQIEVVDDHSTRDDPEAMVAELSGGRAGFHRQPENIGHSRNFNSCIDRARGHLVHILHADDAVAPGFYDHLGRLFADHPEIGAAFTGHVIVDEAGATRWTIPVERETPGVLEGWLAKIASRQRIQTPSIAVRREVYERLDGFDDRIQSCGEDWEMWVRIAAHYPVGYDPAVLAFYTDATASLTKRALRSGQNIRDLRTASRLAREYLPSSAWRANAASYDAWAVFAKHLAREARAAGDGAAMLAQWREAAICRLAARRAQVAAWWHRPAQDSGAPSRRRMAVLDLDIDALPETLVDPEGRTAALVLLRVDGRPAGQALIGLPAPGGYGLRDRLLAAADSGFWEAWLRRDLGLPAPGPAPGTPPTATVAVCTRDRPDDLVRCLAALEAMPDDGQQILIVDNAPATDATRALVARHPRLSYVREDRPGLDVARNRALAEATGEVVAFTDDDAAPDPAWLRTLVRNFTDPLVMVACGATLPLELETNAQIDFQRHGGFLRGYKRRIFEAARTDPLLAWQAGAGVNMAIRRSVTAEVGAFDEALDAGTPTQAGGDSEFFRRVIVAGYRVVHDPEAITWHRHRRTDAELIRQLEGYEVAASALRWKALTEGDLHALSHHGRWLKRELAGLVRGLARRPGAPSPGIALARLKGGFRGAWAYRRARAR
ncbi:MAG: glycosyltransferase [Gemmatimonadales bacterium]